MLIKSAFRSSGDVGSLLIITTRLDRQNESPVLTAPSAAGHIKMPAVRRRRTDASTDTVASSIRRRFTKPFQRQAEEEQEARPERHQQRYSVYNALTWDTLKGFLLSKWPEETFNECRVRSPRDSLMRR